MCWWNLKAAGVVTTQREHTGLTLYVSMFQFPGQKSPGRDAGLVYLRIPSGVTSRIQATGLLMALRPWECQLLAFLKAQCSGFKWFNVVSLGTCI